MNFLKRLLTVGLVALLVHVPIEVKAQSPLSRIAGRFVASNYAKWSGQVVLNVTAAGAATISLARGTAVRADGTEFMPYATNAPITVGTETVTPTAVSSSCTSNANYGACQITATFANAHGPGDQVTSGTFGLQEAINDANAAGGGTVVVDSSWAGTTATITSVTSTTPKVWVEDLRGPGPVTWFGKSGTGAAAYSASNNDYTFTVTLAAGTATKTLSQTYSAAPTCVATDTTAAAATRTAPTTSTVVVTGTTTDVIAVHCDYVK